MSFPTSNKIATVITNPCLVHSALAVYPLQVIGGTSIKVCIIVSCFSIYSGHHSILIAPSEVETNPAVWHTAVSNYKGECSWLP